MAVRPVLVRKEPVQIPFSAFHALFQCAFSRRLARASESRSLVARLIKCEIPLSSFAFVNSSSNPPAPARVPHPRRSSSSSALLIPPTDELLPPSFHPAVPHLARISVRSYPFSWSCSASMKVYSCRRGDCLALAGLKAYGYLFNANWKMLRPPSSILRFFFLFSPPPSLSLFFFLIMSLSFSRSDCRSALTSRLKVVHRRTSSMHTNRLPSKTFLYCRRVRITLISFAFPDRRVCRHLIILFFFLLAMHKNTDARHVFARSSKRSFSAITKVLLAWTFKIKCN